MHWKLLAQKCLKLQEKNKNVNEYEPLSYLDKILSTGRSNTAVFLIWLCLNID